MICLCATKKNERFICPFLFSFNYLQVHHHFAKKNDADIHTHTHTINAIGDEWSFGGVCGAHTNSITTTTIVEIMNEIQKKKKL